MEAFTASFLCYVGWILDIYWPFGCFWGPVEPFWRPFAGFGALFAPFGDHLGLSWWQSSTYQGMLALFVAFLDPIWVSAGDKLPPFRLLAI